MFLGPSRPLLASTYVYVCSPIFPLVKEYISLRTRTLCQNAKELERGRASGHSRRGFGAILAACHAWQALYVVLPVEGAVSRGIKQRSRSIFATVCRLVQECSSIAK